MSPLQTDMLRETTARNWDAKLNIAQSKAGIQHFWQLTLIALVIATANTRQASGIVQLSFGDLTEANKTLIAEMEAEFAKGATGTKNNAIRHGTNFVRCQLKAGLCDEAYKLMQALKGQPRSYVEHYCFAMAIAGRSDEIPAKVEMFRDSQGVKRRLRDEECDFELLCEVPTRHGTAVRHAIDGNLSGAITEAKAVEKLGRFSSEFSDNTSAIAYEIFHSSDPETCIKFLETMSDGKERKFSSLTRSLVIHLREKANPLLFQLLPDHKDTFFHEFALATMEPVSTREEPSARALIDFMIPKLSQLEEMESINLRVSLSRSSLLEPETRNQFASESLKWLQSKPSEDHRSKVRTIAPWLIKNGMIEELKNLALAYDAKDKFKYSTVVSSVMKSLPVEHREDAIRISKMLPDPSQIHGRDSYKSDVFDFLIESHQFDAASNWLASISKKKTKEACSPKLELYRLIESSRGESAEEVAESIANFISTEKNSDFPGYDFMHGLLASVAEMHDLETSLQTARKIHAGKVQNSTPVNDCLAAMIRFGKLDEALKVADLATTEEMATERLWSSRDIRFHELTPDFIERLAKDYPNCTHLQRTRARNAIKDKKKALAFRLNQQLIANLEDNMMGRHFVDAGWGDEYVAASKRIAGTKNRTLVRESIYEAADTLTMHQGVKQAIPFIQKHTAAAEERLWLYHEISDTLENPSTNIWIR